jgi:protein-ribulosamine 3-kinase
VSGQEPAFLVLERIVAGRRRSDFDEALGRGLSALHRFGAVEFGLDHDNFIGRLPQSNRPAATWAEFYRDRRIQPQLRQAADQGLASPRMLRGGERLWWVRPSRPAACTAICGAATSWWTRPGRPA